MKKSKFTSTQIASILKSFDNGRSADVLTRAHGMTRQTYYLWRQLCG